MPGGRHYTAVLCVFPFPLETANLFPLLKTTELTDTALAFKSRKITHL